MIWTADPKEYIYKSKEVSEQKMTDRLCGNCKYYSFMNAFCKENQVPKEQKESCSKFDPYDGKPPCAKTKKDCDDCDGSCDCHDDNYTSQWCGKHCISGGCYDTDD